MEAAGPDALDPGVVVDVPAHGVLEAELGWTPSMPLDKGLEDTVRWYVDNYAWVDRIRQRGFESERLGLVKA